jgi:hypothetical protein
MSNFFKKIILEKLILESRKDDITKKWLNYIQKDELLRFQFKPESVKETINYLSEKDPSGNNKYLDWLCKQVFLNGFSMFDLIDDVDFYHNNLNRITKDFIENITSIKKTPISYLSDEKKILKNPKDINSFSNIRSLEFFVSELEKFKTKGEIKKDDQKSKSINRLLNTNEVLVIEPLTVESSCKYGSGTKWCTSADKSENQFINYSKSGSLIYIIKKNENKKFAIYIPYGNPHDWEFYDEMDLHIRHDREPLSSILTRIGFNDNTISDIQRVVKDKHDLNSGERKMSNIGKNVIISFFESIKNGFIENEYGDNDNGLKVISTLDDSLGFSNTKHYVFLKIEIEPDSDNLETFSGLKLKWNLYQNGYFVKNGVTLLPLYKTDVSIFMLPTPPDVKKSEVPKIVSYTIFGNALRIFRDNLNDLKKYGNN